nr:hypothetical protein [Sorangium cellulosum]
MLERLPGHLEQQPLLRIQLRGLAGRDPEEMGVEPVNVLQECAPGRGLLIGPRRGGVALEALRRRLGHGVDARFQQLPVALRVVRAAGEAAPEADDRDRLGLLSLERGQPGLQILDDRRRPEQA